MKRFNVIREETSANNKVDTGITKAVPQIGGPTTTNSAGPVMKPTAKKAPGSRTPRIAHQQTSGPVKEDHENEFTANKQFNLNKGMKKAKSTDYFGYNAKKQTKATVKEHIVKVGSKFRLVSKKSGKNLGTSDTKAGALKREREVEYFKHVKEDAPAMSAGSNVAATNNPSDNYALQKDRGMKRLKKLLKRNPKALT